MEQALVAETAAEVGRLAASVAGSLAGGAGLEAAELVLRTGLAQLGCALLEPLLAADGGYRGPRIDCGAGHQAEFTSYRDKAIGTVLGPVTVRRAGYLGFPSQRGDILLKGGVSMGETRRKFDRDFREGAVRLVRETGKPIAIDGTGVPMIPAETNDRPGKAEDGRAHTREVKLCCVFTQATVDIEGRPVRDPGSSSYLAAFAPPPSSGT